jgi:hypothetical protein
MDRDARKTVLLIGAGVTRAAASSVRAKTKQPPVDTDFFSIAQAVAPRQTATVASCLKDLLGDYADTVRTSLETTTTYLYIKAADAPRGSRYHTAFLELLELINSVLAYTTNDLSLGPRSLLYRFLLSEIEPLDDPRNFTVLTFNYDLLLERTLDSIASRGRPEVFSFPNCYRLGHSISSHKISGHRQFANQTTTVTGASILKLHGSMNWQSRHQANQPEPRQLFRTNRNLYVMDAPRIGTRLRWRPRRRTVYMKPAIVPPISGKRGMIHEQISPLWTYANKALANADRVVIAGYSCPPLDLEARFLLAESLRVNNNKRVYVINPDASAAAQFIDICGVDHTTIYSSLSQWVADAPYFRP